MKKIIAMLLLITTFYSCERDDICPESTPTTPHLVISFFDVDDQDETLNVIFYSFLGLFKIFWLIFNVTPYITLFIMGKK